MEAIRRDYEAPTPEDISRKSSERKGVMSRIADNVSDTMQNTASSSLEGIKDLISTTIGSRSDVDTPEEVDLEKESELDARVNSIKRGTDGINRSLTEEERALAYPSKDVPSTEASDATDPGLMSKPVGGGVSGVDTFKVPEFKSYKTAEEMPDLEILARTIEAEASGEAFEGKIAVGSVIANRVASGSYGGSGGIKGVILKKAQFSPWNTYTDSAGGKQGKDMLNFKASEDSYKAARDILSGNYTDPTNGATHYVNESVAEGQSWIDTMKARKKGTVIIGRHLFGNADNEKVYDGKSEIAKLSSETTDQPLIVQPPNVKDVQRIIGITADGQFGNNSRNKTLEYLKAKNVSAPENATDQELIKLVKRGPPLHILKATRAEYKPSPEMPNISLDFNSFKGAKGTEVIIPDNASAEIRASAENFNNLVVAFAEKHGYSGYRNRGVKTKSQNKRGISNTIHVEPFFQQDSAMEKIINDNMEEFAQLYSTSFGNISARMVAPHGATNKKGIMDKGANSTTFGNELNFGNRIIDILQAGN